MRINGRVKVPASGSIDILGQLEVTRSHGEVLLRCPDRNQLVELRSRCDDCAAQSMESRDQVQTGLIEDSLEDRRPRSTAYIGFLILVRGDVVPAAILI